MLSDSQKLSLLELYSEEICKRLHYLNEDKASDLLELVDVGTVGRLREEFPQQFGEKLWLELRTSPLQEQKKGLFNCLQAYLHDVGDDLHSILSEVYTRNRFYVVLQHLDLFLQFLDFDKCVEQLKAEEHYKDVLESILDVCDDMTDADFKKKLLLRTIPCLSPTSVYDVMMTMYDSSPEATQFIESIHPNFMRYYRHIQDDRKNPHGVITLWPKECDLSLFLRSHIDPSITTEAIPVDMNFEDLPNAPGVKRRLLTCINNRMFKETPLNLRDYQKELCEKADEGKNCIIAAPTGSGKTIVAASIIRNHLNAGPVNGRKKDPKVLFLVNGTAILSQQADCMAKFLDHKFTVDRISGMDQKPFKEVVHSHDVVVCTPQLVVNQLWTDASTDFDFTPSAFRLDEFSLIIFDECHNTRKGSPYSVLMRHYHEKKFTGEYKHGPQIVGLTASMGVGNGAKNAADAIGHITRLCALMDCTVVSVVRRHIGQLHEFSPPTIDQFDFVPSSEMEPERMTYILTIHKAMAKMEQLIKGLYQQANIQVARAESESDLESLPERTAGGYTQITDPPHDKGCFEYLGWVANHIRRLIPESSMQDNIKKKVTEIFEVLEIFYRSLELCDDFTTEKSLEHMEEEFRMKRRFLTPEIDTILQDVQKQLRPNITKKCVLVESAEKLLLDQHKVSGNFRAIVFVRTRKGTKILSSLLNECAVLQEAGIKAESLFGINAPDEGGNKRLQEEKLERFKTGETRVLVSTSVADEGLDIAQCSLVIKYNYTTNEIAHVQRRGRGRAKESRCVLVTNSARLLKQEEGNIMKERLMKEAMASMEKKSFDLPRMVEIEVKLLREEILKGNAKKKDTVQAQKGRGIEYEIRCKKCAALLCMDRHVKTNRTQYYVTDPAFWSRTVTLPMDQRQCAESKFGEVGKLYCAGSASDGCGKQLGCLVRIKDSCMPVLAAEAIVIVNQKTGDKKAFKKWKKVTEDCFTPEAVRAFDLAEMQQASTFKLQFTGVP